MFRTSSVVAVALAAFIAAAVPAAQQDSRRYINARTAADATLPPFSGAVEVVNTLYLSGEIGLDANNRVPDTAEGEARLLMDRVQRTLQAAGYTMDDLVSVQIFCSDVAHYDAFNKVYRTYFKGRYPARAFIGSGKLLFDARFELQGVAARPLR